MEDNTTSAGNETLTEEGTTTGNETVAQNTTEDVAKEEAKPKKIYKKYDDPNINCM